MKVSRGKLPLSIIAVVIGSVALAGIIFTEDLRVITGISIPKIKACSRQETNASTSSTTSTSTVSKEEKERSALENVEEDEDKMAFDKKECRVMEGKWVFNPSNEPLYTDETCPYIDRQFTCSKNGRPDKDYLYWEWEPDDCILPRFNATMALDKIRGKKVMFVGDSLQRGQWLSFVCLIQTRIPPEQKSMNVGRTLSIFTAKEYNATVEFYWAPYLVESNSDGPLIITNTRMRVLHVDSIEKHARNWTNVDIFVFNTYIWWKSGHKIKSVWGNFSNRDEGYEELDVPFAYRLGMKSWANWIDSNIDPNKTKVFFTTASPTHIRALDWHGKAGTKCYNETRPILEKGFWGTVSDREMMQVVSSISSRMKIPVTFINITQLSDYRVDAHPSVYTETGGRLLTKKQRANPWNADCIHWCLPGIPDTWNRIFYAYL